jgi:hypothetical protein
LRLKLKRWLFKVSEYHHQGSSILLIYKLVLIVEVNFYDTLWPLKQRFCFFMFFYRLSLPMAGGSDPHVFFMGILIQSKMSMRIRIWIQLIEKLLNYQDYERTVADIFSDYRQLCPTFSRCPSISVMFYRTISVVGTEQILVCRTNCQAAGSGSGTRRQSPCGSGSETRSVANINKNSYFFIHLFILLAKS